MYKIEQLIRGEIKIPPVDETFIKENKRTWDRVAKPLDSMGRFETYLSMIGGIQQTILPRLDRVRLLVLCADNGVVEEKISQSDQSITAICAENIGNGISSVGIMASRLQVDLTAVDMGMNTNRQFTRVLNKKIRMGSRNFVKESALTMEEAMQAIQTGMDLVLESKKLMYDLVAMGEMGIGNTTTSSTVAAALLHKNAKEVTGKGAGLSNQGLLHKIEVIQSTLEKNNLWEKEPMEVLCRVGGYDIAGMVGICLGGALYQMPVLLDGLISMVSALVAERLAGGVAAYLIPSHTSKEVAAKLIEKELHLYPVIDAGMALGEGTGAMMAIPMFRLALEVYKNSTSFENAGIEAYTRGEAQGSPAEDKERGENR